MRGTILGVDSTNGEGVVADASGVRHSFSAADWKSGGIPAVGQSVDYSISGDRATDVYLVPGGAASGGYPGGAAPHVGAPADPLFKQAQTNGIIALVAGILAWTILFPIALIPDIVAIIWGLKAKNQGAGFASKGPYYLGIAGLVLGVLSIIGWIFFLVACGGLTMLSAMSGNH